MSREEKNIHKDRKTYPDRQTGVTRKNSDFNGSRNFRDQRRAPKRDYRDSSYGEREKNAEQNARRYDSDSEDESCGVIVGRNAVRELLKSGRDIDKIFVRKGDREGSIVVLVATAIERKIPVVEVESQKLDTLAGSGQHQGIVAMAAGKEYSSVEDILAIAAERGEKPLIVIADGITDPYNLGAIIRCAEGCGAHGIIIPKRRAVGLTPAVTKASAGAIEYMAVAKVANIAATIEQLKKNGVWIFSAEAGGESCYNADFDIPAAIVLGSEGNGVSKIVKDKSDYIISIPMYGNVNSFNVSTAAAILLAEAVHQRKKN